MLLQRLFTRLCSASFPERTHSKVFGTHLNFVRAGSNEPPPPPPDEFPRKHRRGVTPRSPVIRTIALLCAIALTTLFALPFISHSASEKSYTTRVGEHLAIPLED